MKKEYTLDEVSEVAEEILAEAKHKIVLFYGEMGVGKTTLIKEICKKMGIKEITHSPTFSIVNEYLGSDATIYHFDFYRLTKEEEAYDIGIEDYLYSDHWCFIEWPENIKNLLPLESTEIYISLLSGGKRYIQLKN